MDHLPSSNLGSSLGVLSRIALLVALLSTLSLQACRGTNEPESGTAELTPFTVRIDWVPSPEYYGFFYAKEEGFYKEVGLEVTISYGSGAPVVAKELATGAAYVGSTTSFSVLQEISHGASFSRVTPIFRFNPAVLASLSDTPIKALAEVKGKTIGVNKQGSEYRQLQFLLKREGIASNTFKEYPIGWGGAAQLVQDEVDGILAYTTNVVVDIELMNKEVNELAFDDLGVHTFGLVVAVASDEVLQRKGIVTEAVDRFLIATLRGYSEGGRDIDGAVAALMRAEPTLNERKLRIAIAKIQRLNEESTVTLQNVDRWLIESRDVTQSDFDKAMSLYK